MLAVVASAEVIQLKDQASITGRILAEKRDQVAVDIGYTVLSVPRSHIVRITSEKNNKPSAQKAPATPAPRPDLFLNSSAPAERSVQDWVLQLGEAVVQVRTPGGLGSGFILNDEGYLITNFHVIENESPIAVEVYHQTAGALERKTYKQVQIVAMNKFADLALLKILDAGAARFVPAPLGDVEAMNVGDRVFAVGSPLGLERTVTEGILSTKTRPLEGALYLQTTAQINPGNSGGPLFNLRGEVIGVTSMKIAFGEGIGFAIPADTVKYFLAHREAYAYDNDNPNNPYRYLSPNSQARQTTLVP
jgi:serine protease Do